MGSVATVKVSARGQLSLPAKARHRWHLDGGGEIGAIDLGDAVLLVPGGEDGARKSFRAAVESGAISAAIQAIDDSDLATE